MVKFFDGTNSQRRGGVEKGYAVHDKYDSANTCVESPEEHPHTSKYGEHYKGRVDRFAEILSQGGMTKWSFEDRKLVIKSVVFKNGGN